MLTGIICIRSTVEPWLQQSYGIEFQEFNSKCPEFLRERSAFEDFIDYGFASLVLTTLRMLPRRSKTYMNRSLAILLVSLTEAELIKYFSTPCIAHRFCKFVLRLCTELTQIRKCVGRSHKRNNISAEYPS